MEKAREFQKNIYFCFIDYTKAFHCVDHNKLWKILKEIDGKRNLYACQEATVRTGYGTTDWFQIGKGVCQSCILSPCLFNLYAKYIMHNARLNESQVESRLLEEISITSDTQMTPPLWQKWRRTKEPLGESGEWKSWLKAQHSENSDHGIWSHHFMQIAEETMETVREFILVGSKITADGDFSHEIKRCLLLGRIAMTNLDSLLKSRDFFCWQRSI